ncbi:MAG: metalloregulator ArsR/SmtB family transcription factor [Bacteroidetes bacterium]|jgi:DNA-binding transcriptional ArsR family regulator|nr:metalloregulator ArsR/SmtB family transcription factor [Bacteroidota bacterium]
MPITRTDRFKPKDVRLSLWAKALSHPARVAILRTLAKRNACVCGEIVELLPIAQATVSQHVKELKNAGLVDGTIEGPSSCYCLNKDAIEKLAADLNALFDELRSGCTTTSCSTKGKE